MALGYGAQVTIVGHRDPPRPWLRATGALSDTTGARHRSTPSVLGLFAAMQGANNTAVALCDRVVSLGG